jgi:hypothetical protein
LLRALVSMYCVRDSNNIIIVPQISGHVVNMGDASDFENKFAKLLLFYREVMPKRGWNTFDTISVKWNHQIVATRRVKAVVPTIEFDPEDDEQAPDIKTMDMTLLPKGSNEGNEQGNESDKKKEDEAAKPSTTTNSGNNNQAKPEKDKKKNN